MQTSTEIGARIRKFRKKRGMTQEQLAEKMEVTFQQVQQYENGATRLNSDRLQKLAEVLKIPVGSLFEDSDERALTEEEALLIKGFRSIESADVRSFILSALTRK